MNPRRLSRPRLSLLAATLLLALVPAVAAAQEETGRVIPMALGRAQLEVPGTDAVRVGLFGGGLSALEAERPALAPLAERFRLQRRTGILLGLAAVVGGAVALERFSDPSEPPLQMGDPEANVMLGALGAMTLSIIQLEASGRTLRRLADGLQHDERYVRR